MRSRWLARSAGFAVAYAVAVGFGRLTVMDATSLSLVWPAAGIGALWFWFQRRSPVRWVDAAALAVITLVLNTATGAPAGLAMVFVGANLAQMLVFTHLLARWRPHLADPGVDGPRFGTTGDLWALLAASAVSTACGAVVGPVGVWLASGDYSPMSVAVWLARNIAAVLTIGAVGLRLADVLRRRPDHTPGGTPRRAPVARAAEYAAVVLCSALAYVVAFALAGGLPLAFLLLALTVWAAVRLPTTFVVLHTLATGTTAVLFTLAGTGPFALITDDATRVLIAQAFVIVVATIGLALALSRDERAALVRALEAETAAARHQADLMSTIVNSMADGLAVVDADGHVLLRNPAADELLGGHAGSEYQITDPVYYGFFHPDGTPVTVGELPYVRTLTTARPHDLDILVRNPSVPQGRIVHATATPLPRRASHDDGRRAVALFHDVTAERRHRDELATFAGVVAHDLLNPVTTIQGWVDLTTDMLDDAPPAPVILDIEDGLERIRHAANRMSRFINDLLAYTTARDTALIPAPLDLQALFADIAAARMDAAIASRTPIPRFDIGPLPRIQADPVLMRQLADNLVSNAVKYTAPGTTPHITIHTTEDTAPGTVAIQVTDNGIGIPDGQHDAIFTNFHRAHANTTYAGTGLGLAICRRIAERHGGTITAAADPCGGSRFTITLPAVAPVRSEHGRAS
ncbi:ATP-binding protein [Actinophytocola xanthii]|uniref:Sensor-like histidine kinase SenX3 n=1 Tax=Actinophytocola xanthii TaxID=1912961 RepID=A0A1Q8CW88_9PSEU|nr:ATP-binding protein [Actinophytocola xanthii]OLF18602.1 histidine kinase [Actinophytocola xanthii]